MGLSIWESQHTKNWRKKQPTNLIKKWLLAATQSDWHYRSADEASVACDYWQSLNHSESAFRRKENVNLDGDL